MSARKQVKDYERALARDPTNPALRLKLAAALRAAGRREDSNDLVRSVAVAYQQEGRLVQALAVCRSLLELEPNDLSTLALYAEIDAARTGAPGEEPTRHADGTGRRALPPVEAPLEAVEVAPDEYDFDDGASDAQTPPGTAARTRPASTAPEADTSPTPLADLDVPPGMAPFASLPPAAQAELAARRVERRFASGDIIVREGEASDSCFIVASGLVRVLHREPDGTATEVGRLGAGELFGDFALLADRRRHATVQAVESTALHEIPRRVLRELAATWPDVGIELERLYRERLVATLLAHAPFFRPVPFDQRGALMARFVSVRLEGGATVVREGERGGGLYLVVLGSVEITKRATGGRAVLLATLGEGAYFGEMSLLAGGLATATVTAAGPTELAQLGRREFHAAIATYPALWDELRGEAKRRELANQNILAGDTNLV